MQQVAQQRPGIYGKRSQSVRFAQGIGSLTERRLPSESAKLQRPTPSPAKYRKTNSLQAKASDDFDVPSSDDEAKAEKQRSASTLEQAPVELIPSSNISEFHGAANISKSKAATPSSRRQREAVPGTPIFASSKSSQKKQSARHALSIPFRENDDTKSEIAEATVQEADTYGKKVSATPRQSRLWTELLDEDSEPENYTQTCDLQKLRLESPSTPWDGDLSCMGRPQSHKILKLVDKLKPSEDRGLLFLDNSCGHTTSSECCEDEDETEESPLQFISAANPGPSITYSQQRTCLEDGVSHDQFVPETMEALEPVIINDAYDIPGRWGLQLNQGEDEENGQGVKSIHELRASGDAFRFDNEVSELLDDIEADGYHSLPSQRSNLIVLATRLGCPKFRQRFLDGSYQHRLFQNIMRNEDTICLTVSAAAVALLLSGDFGVTGTSSQFLAEIPIAMLPLILSNSNTLLHISKDRQMNLSRFAQNSLSDFQSLLLKSGLFAAKDTSELTPRDIGLTSLELVLRRVREAGIGVNPMTSAILNQLIEVGNASLTDMFGNSLRSLEMILSILEISTALIADNIGESLWTPDEVRSALPLLEAAIQIDGGRDTPLHQVALKMSLNLSNNSKSNSDVLNSRSLITAILDSIYQGLQAESWTKSDPKESVPNKGISEQLDTLILSLGAMMNLSETSSLVRQAVERDHRPAFDSILHLFIANRKNYHESNSISGASRQIAFGYVAILLANLAQSPRLRAHILALLPGGQIQSLVEVVEEFVGQHLEADRQSQDGQDWIAFTERLQAVLESLKDVAHA